MTKEQALNCIEQKDWMRARTVAPTRVHAMFSAITDTRKLIGRTLAFYYTYKYILPYAPGRDAIMLDALRFLGLLVQRDIISEWTFNELKDDTTPSQIIRYVSDSTLNRYLQQAIDSGAFNRQNLGFFNESKHICESLLLDKNELAARIEDLRDEYPDKFEGIDNDEVWDSLKNISIDYLDGCTDLVFNDDNIVDITGNSTDITNQPAYKTLMTSVFEGVVDKWLEEHNLTHKDIVWFDYDPETNQMFVEFDANNVDLDELEKMNAKDVEEYSSEDNEDLEEEFTRDALSKLEKELINKLKDREIYCNELWFEVPDFNPEILKLIFFIDGDWKHDHLQAEKVVEEFAGEKNWKVLDSSSETLEETGRDDYPANHMFTFKVPETELGKDEMTEDFLDETYSDEELDKMVGKTYNQQKIQNIYRRNKYNDKRLFAHTRCVNCGREKRVFLSNLINDPKKYGSCVCSNTNVESRLDNIEDLFSGQKKLSNNTSGYTGVSYIKTYKGELYDKWRAYIEVDGKRTYLGDFDSKSAAIRARKKAAEKGLKWYKEHKNEFMKNYRKKSKKYRKGRK